MDSDRLLRKIEAAESRIRHLETTIVIIKDKIAVLEGQKTRMPRVGPPAQLFKFEPELLEPRDFGSLYQDFPIVVPKEGVNDRESTDQPIVE